MVQSASTTTTPPGRVSRTAASASGPSRAAVDPVTTPPRNPIGTPPLRGRAKATQSTAATVTFWSAPPGGPSRRSPGRSGQILGWDRDVGGGPRRPEQVRRRQLVIGPARAPHDARSDRSLLTATAV